MSLNLDIINIGNTSTVNTNTGINRASVVASKQSRPKSSFYSSILIAIVMVVTLLIGVITPSYGAIDVYDFDSERQEAQYRGLIDEFRCPKCQNQNLAGSDAPIAQDLKQKTYDMVKDGRSDTEIRQYMQERYGDFISYNPPVRPSTWILWFFPPLLLIIALGGWFWRSNAKQKKPVTSSASTTAASLNTEEQAALDKLLARRASSSELIADETTSSPKSNKQAGDKGESL